MTIKKSKGGKLVIHYFRSDAQYKTWALWIWEFPQGQGKQFEFTSKDEFGATAILDLSKWSRNVTINNLGFIIKTKDSWNCKDGGGDRKVNFSKLEKDEKGLYHIYVKSNDSGTYRNAKLDNVDAFEFARFEDYKTIHIKSNEPLIEYKIFEDDKVLTAVKCKETVKEFNYTLKKDAEIEKSYRIEAKSAKNKTLVKEHINVSRLYRTEKFAKTYKFDGELGAKIEGNKTTFRVWSPVSSKIILKVYKSGTPTSYNPKKGNDDVIYEVPMTRVLHGIFEAEINKNLHGYYYTYVVTNDTYKDREITDIYAKSSGINGLRGMIVDFSKTNPLGFENVKVHDINPRHLTVYEVHIADISASKTWSESPKARKLEKTFLGACLEGTTYYENGRIVKTGFDHIKELGVNAVQLLPIFDHSNDEAHMTFNWGYNPVNYNILEGGYSSNPYDGLCRILEFKELVKKYNEAGMNIIMDVVYNHVNGVPGSNFDVLMPGYYFRYCDNGTLSNGSGCGNETASEMPMMRKFMIDSVLFWAKEYKLGGFRFDLMGLHDIETMNELSDKLHRLNKNIVIYGEPWGGGQSMLPYHEAAVKDNANRFEGFGYFNDTVRDALVRESCARVYAGWCANSFNDSYRDQENVATAIRGACLGVCDPNKILNYVSCHDNRTLYDKIKNSGVTDEKEIKRIATLANAIVLTSNGMSLILSGEEFLRTKGGCENSYNAPYEVNALDYSLKIKHFDLFKTYQKLIHLKQTVSDLALIKEQNMLLNVDISAHNIIHYELDDVDNNRKYIVYHLNGLRTGRPCIVNLKGYNLYLDTINPNKELSESTSLIGYETLIGYKDLK